MNPSSELSGVLPSHATKRRARRYVWLVVCAVLVSIVILAGLMNKKRNFVAVGDAMAAIRTIETNLLRYKTMAGILPTKAQGLHALAEQPTSDPMPTSWHKLTEASSLIDPWGQPYQYRNPGKRQVSSFDVYSLGPDRLDGTQDDLYSIYSH